MDEPVFRQYLQLQAQLREGLVPALKAHAARLQARTALESRENAVIWASAESRLPAGSAARYLPLLLPSGPRRRIRLSKRRRDAYRNHLLRILAEIAAGPKPLATPAPLDGDRGGPTTLAGRVCAMCSGGCCVRGGDTAFLSADTIRRFMSRRLQLEPAGVLAAYLDRVQARTETGSCIHHTAQGCSLPREMRSDICNNYVCESLVSLQRAQREAADFDGVIAIRRRQTEWTRGTLLQNNEITGVAVITQSGTAALPLHDRSDR